MRTSYALVQISGTGREFPFKLPLPDGTDASHFPRLEGVSMAFDAEATLAQYRIALRLGLLVIEGAAHIPLVTIPDREIRPAEYRALAFLDAARRQIYYDPEKWKMSLQFLDEPKWHWREFTGTAGVVIAGHFDFGERSVRVEGAAPARAQYWKDRFEKGGKRGKV